MLAACLQSRCLQRQGEYAFMLLWGLLAVRCHGQAQGPAYPDQPIHEGLLI